MQKIQVHTFFDITNTGVRNYSKNKIDQRKEVNQQRNWETFLQCISLRCQPLNIKGPFCFTNVEDQLFWEFSFETDKTDIFLLDKDPLGLLKQDCHNVPIIIGLDESEKELFFTPYIITKGSSVNTIFNIL